MKIRELKEKADDALVLELNECHKRLYALRTQSVTEKLADPSQLNKTRKDIARIKTVLRQRQIDSTKTS